MIPCYAMCNALSPSSIFSTRRPLSAADKAIHAFIVAIARSGAESDVIFIDFPFKWADVRMRLVALAPGGFVYIRGSEREWFHLHGWQSMPFTWRGYYIWRKPVLREEA